MYSEPVLDATPSRTALAATFARAAHLRLDDPPPVFDDGVAYSLLPAYQRRAIRRLGLVSQPWLRRLRPLRDVFTAMRAQIVVRARYTEDALAQARNDRVKRYVVLAAGLDTFAVRQIEQHQPRIAVVEIDHPATQRWKRELLLERNAALPDDLTFLAIDFEQMTLADGWIEGQAPDFVSWLGGTYYLTRQAVSNTLTTLVERTQPGSELVLDYWCEPPALDASSPLLWSSRVAVALLREPMRSFFEPAEIEALAKSAGWRVREHCPPSEQNHRYLECRRDRLAVPSFAHLLHLKH